MTELNDIEKKAIEKGHVTMEEIKYLSSNFMWLGVLYRYPSTGDHLIVRTFNTALEDVEIGLGYDKFFFRDDCAVDKQYIHGYWFASLEGEFEKQFKSLKKAIEFSVKYLKKDLKKKLKQLKQFK